jgi:DNA-binding NarL/FixJ family response regulator
MGDIQLLIADSQPLTLSGLRTAVADQADIEVLAECQNPDRLMDAVRKHTPDVLLVSTDFLEEKLDALERLAMEVDETRVIVLTDRKDPDFLEEALRCGARGVIQREWPIHQIPVAIRKVTSGGFWLERTVADRVLQNILNGHPAENAEARKIASLTQREREVIGLICQGLRNKNIAGALHISDATVSHHLTSIYRKLEVDDRTSLVIYSAKHSMVKFDGGEPCSRRPHFLDPSTPAAREGQWKRPARRPGPSACCPAD